MRGGILTLLKRISGVLSIAASIISLFAAIWIIVPAPSFYVWLLAVVASEWSLWLAALAAIGIIGNLTNDFSGGKLWRAAIITAGISAVIISLYPLASAVSVARENGVSLSAQQYFAGLPQQQSGNTFFTQSEKTTYTFANVFGTALQLDAYLPPLGIANNGAGVIVVHGGSWNGGARSDFPQWNRWLARQGFAVFDIDYRLAPQPNWQAATGDVKCAVGWVGRHAAEFNISPERLVLLGRSAGAHLALLAAYSPGDARLPSSCPDTPAAYVNNPVISPSENTFSDNKVRAVISFYAPTDFLWDYENPANQAVIDGPATLRNFLGGSPDESAELRERFLLASPVEHINSQTPPTMIIHGGRDQLVRSENADFLDSKLSAAGVPHKTVFIPYAQHGFDYNFDGWGAQIVQPLLLDFLRENTAPE